MFLNRAMQPISSAAVDAITTTHVTVEGFLLSIAVILSFGILPVKVVISPNADVLVAFNTHNPPPSSGVIRT